MDISNLVKRSLASIKAADIPDFPVASGGNWNGQALGKSSTSSGSSFPGGFVVGRPVAPAGSQSQNERPVAENRSRVDPVSITGKLGKLEKVDRTSSWPHSQPGNGLETTGTGTEPECTPMLNRVATGGRCDSVVVAWRASLEALPVASDPCPGFRPGRWLHVRSAALAFVDGFGAQAIALGWGTLDLFGVHRDVGVVRVDCAGALMVSGGSRVVAITDAAIRFDDGLAAYRHRSPEPTVAVWDFASRRSSHAGREG